jgi:hypothetical protein
MVLAVLGTASWSAAQVATPESQLADAKRLFDATNYEGAAAALDTLVTALEPQSGKDAAIVKVLTIALELRARARFFLGNAEGARSDFRALFKLSPGYTLTTQVSSRVRAVFDEIQKTTVGKIVLNLTPVDAELALDGAPFTAAPGSIPIVAGTHTLSGKRAGCRSAAQSFTVAPNATTEVVLALERISASLALVTSPPGVDVLVDGVSRGRTEAGPQPPQWVESVAKLGVPASDVSKPLILDDLGQGTHMIEFQRECHTKAERRVVIDKPADFRLDPVKIERAIASIYLDSKASGVTALLDGAPKGTVPLSLDDVCEGSHVVELRSPWGRYVERVTTKTGDKLTVQGVIKPAVALLSVTGLPEGYRGTDLRLDVERALTGAKSMTFFAPPADKVQQAMRAESLSPGWLAFDRWRRPIRPAAAAITPSARLEISRRLAKTLEVQGLAELTARPGGDRNDFFLTVLSSESAEPDVFELTLDEPASTGAAVTRLDTLPGMYRPTSGLTVVDVLDVTGGVVVGVENTVAAAAGFVAGDVITGMGDQPVTDGTSFNTMVTQRKANDKLAITGKDRAGAPKQGELMVMLAPRLVAMNDQSLAFNALALSLRAQLAPGGGDLAAEPVTRLNLAVALMRLGNWTAARAELEKVHLTAGPGVSNGTVQYLLGLCHEALGQAAEAERAWRAAATDADALLTEEGPSIKELAERKLAGGGRQ